MNHTTFITTQTLPSTKKLRITSKKLIIISCLTLLSTQIDANSGFGGGFATGAILGTGITLAATSGARNANRDPYYEVDRERARQEAREIREETRLKREEDRKRRKHKSKQDEEERRLENKKDRLAKEKNKVNHKKSSNNDKKQIKSSPATPEKAHAQHISHKEHEIKKLELEIKKLELEELQEAAAAA